MNSGQFPQHLANDRCRYACARSCSRSRPARSERHGCGAHPAPDTATRIAAIIGPSSSAAGRRSAVKAIAKTPERTIRRASVACDQGRYLGVPDRIPDPKLREATAAVNLTLAALQSCRAGPIAITRRSDIHRAIDLHPCVPSVVHRAPHVHSLRSPGRAAPPFDRPLQTRHVAANWRSAATSSRVMVKEIDAGEVGDAADLPCADHPARGPSAVSGEEPGERTRHPD